MACGSIIPVPYNSRMIRTARIAAFLLVAVVLLGPSIVAQGSAVPVARQFEGLHFRSIGPASMSGRISDFAVYEANPAMFWVASAHGGLWKTTNGGATFTPQFQDEGLIALSESLKKADITLMVPVPGK